MGRAVRLNAPDSESHKAPKREVTDRLDNGRLLMNFDAAVRRWHRDASAPVSISEVSASPCRYILVLPELLCAEWAAKSIGFCGRPRRLAGHQRNTPGMAGTRASPGASPALCAGYDGEHLSTVKRV
jgi:hypothetical protein